MDDPAVVFEGCVLFFFQCCVICLKRKRTSVLSPKPLISAGLRRVARKSDQMHA